MYWLQYTIVEQIQQLLIEDVAGGGTLGIIKLKQLGYDEPTYCSIQTDSGLFASVVITERLQFDTGDLDLTDDISVYADDISVDKVIENQNPSAYDATPFGALYGDIPFAGDTSVLIGAWDYPMWDMGGFDENVSTLADLYNNTL